MKTPKHFSSSTEFTLYILDCAYRDRLSYLESITPDFYEPCEDTMRMIRETKEEIKAIRDRAKALKDRG